MTWNYRVVRRVIKHGDETTTTFGIHEAYYDKAGNCTAITEDPMGPYGETEDELFDDLLAICAAFSNKPVLDYETRRPV